MKPSKVTRVTAKEQPVNIGESIEITPAEIAVLRAYHKSNAAYWLGCKQTNIALSRATPTPGHFTAEEWKERAAMFNLKRKWHRSREKFFNNALP